MTRIIFWHLKNVLFERKITADVFASEMGISLSTANRWRSPDTLPSLSGETISRICEAIEELSGEPCSLSELLTLQEEGDL